MPRSILLLTLILGLGLPGCSMMQPVARYVYQDGQFGVIGIPQNTKFGRKNYQAQAQELMRQHFPDGYEIVRSEEVIEGERLLDTGTKTEFATEPTVNALDQMIKLGRLAQSRSIEQKDKIPILESRIIYKRKMPEGPQGANGFAALASAMPPYYIDPNDMTRCKAIQILADAKKHPSDEKGADSQVQKTSSDAVAAKPAQTPAPTPTPPTKSAEKDATCPRCQLKSP